MDMPATYFPPPPSPKQKVAKLTKSQMNLKNDFNLIKNEIYALKKEKISKTVMDIFLIAFVVPTILLTIAVLWQTILWKDFI